MSPRFHVTALIAAAATAVPGAQTARAQDFDSRVDAIFARWDRAGSPGCALAVVRDGRIVYERGYGIADLDHSIPNGSAMVYYTGSVSKQFTAASIALLVRQGRISLDDDVRRYIPELPDYGRPITIRHLVHHTSGLRDIYVLMNLAGLRMEDVLTDEDALALIARQQELNFMPGDDYLYSNSGYWLLGQIVERVTGESLREYARSNIFEPLGMTHTHFHDEPGHPMANRVTSYGPDGNGGYRITYLQNFDKIGAGGLYTTLGDLALWDANFYDPKVGGNAFLDLIHTRGILNSGDTLAYAFGLNIGSFRGLKTVRHGGSLMGFRAEFLRFPEQRFSVIALCNLGNINPGPLADRVATIYLGDLMEDSPTPRPAPANTGVARPSQPSWNPTAEELEQFTGTFHSEEVDNSWTVVRDGQQLFVDRPVTGRIQLRPEQPDQFSLAGLQLNFERDGAGAIIRFAVAAGRVRNIRFERIR